MPFFYDSTYFVFVIPAILLALFAQWKVRSTFGHYAKVRAGAGYTGAQVAAELLRRQGVSGVKIEPVQGMLADHYDPRTKTLRLSPDVYGSDSIAALGVAAHETGHALQHQVGYAPLRLRNGLVPVAMYAPNAAVILFLLGLFTDVAGLMDLAILLYAATVVFALVTLPVEFDASRRAVALLQGQGFVLPQEATGVRAVLNAAAMTYVAAAAAAILQMVRLVLLRNSRDD